MNAPSKILIAAACALVLAQPAAAAVDEPIHMFVKLGSVANERIILPLELTLRMGQTYRFVVSNPSEEVHVVAAPELAASADTSEVSTLPARRDRPLSFRPGRAIAQGIAVEPGQVLEWTFKPRVAGTFKFGCGEPGHKAAGMTQTVRVVAVHG